MITHIESEKTLPPCSNPVNLSPKDIERFWKKVAKGEPNECWPFRILRDHRHLRNYGIFTMKRRSLSAHRVAWIITNGQIPDGLKILHRCDNPPCCNPSHHWIGTTADNLADRDRKGRQAMGKTSGPYLHPEAMKRGSENGNSKLSEEDIPVIRLRRRNGDLLKDIAQDYGVSIDTIWKVEKRDTWFHLS